MHHIFFCQGFISFFFSTWLTVSWLIESMYSSSTIASANSLIVQDLYPSGGAEHANAISLRLALPVQFAPVHALARRRIQRLGEPSFHETLAYPSHRPQVYPQGSCDLLVILPRISGAPADSSANSRIRAWVSLLANALPRETNFSRSSRSDASSVTRYLFMSASLPLRTIPHTQMTALTRQCKADRPLGRAAFFGPRRRFGQL